MAKVPEYTKNAINRYNAKFDRIAVNLPKGTKERIAELTGKSCNKYISELVLANLDVLEGKQATPEPQAPEPEALETVSEPKPSGFDDIPLYIDEGLPF